jgi:hypothetical protein
MQSQELPRNETSPPISLGKVIQTIGASPVTLWRWEKRGWLPTVRIAGRKYVTAAALAEFNARLARGEFAGTTTKPPGRKRKAGLGEGVAK